MGRFAGLMLVVAFLGCDGTEGESPADVGPACDRESCTTGCCDGDGRCLRSDDVRLCGTDGRRCVACGAGESCRGGVCLRAFASADGCDGVSCAGCCRGRECVGSVADAYCGVGGGACVLCAFWEECLGGQCVVVASRCGPHNCGGCCEDGLRCQDPPTDELCGLGGLVCERCAEGGYRVCADGICAR